MSAPLCREFGIMTYSKGKLEADRTFLVSEVSLTVFLNNNELVTLICSPAAYEELAAGYLLAEGFVRDSSDIKGIDCRGDEEIIRVQTASQELETASCSRRCITSCGGKSRPVMYPVGDIGDLKPVSSPSKFPAPHIVRMAELLEEKSGTFRLTGGVHSAALADSTGLLVMYEDIGRHNAVDKVFGYSLLNNIPPHDKCLLFSGRVSSEILIKCARRGIPLIVARNAPTQLAVEMADKLGITVIGFARGQRFGIYTHPDRVMT